MYKLAVTVTGALVQVRHNKVSLSYALLLSVVPALTCACAIIYPRPGGKCLLTAVITYSQDLVSCAMHLHGVYCRYRFPRAIVATFTMVYSTSRLAFNADHMLLQSVVKIVLTVLRCDMCLI